MSQPTAMDLMNQNIDPRTYQRSQQDKGIVVSPKDCVHSPEKLLALEKLARDPAEIERKLKLRQYVPQILLDHYYRTRGRAQFAAKEAQHREMEQALNDAPLEVGAYSRAELEGFKQEELIMLCRTYCNHGIDMTQVKLTTPPQYLITWILRGQENANVVIANQDVSGEAEYNISTAAKQVADMRCDPTHQMYDVDFARDHADKEAQLSTASGVKDALAEATGGGVPPAHLVEKFVVPGDKAPAIADDNETSAFDAPPVMPDSDPPSEE